MSFSQLLTGRLIAAVTAAGLFAACGGSTSPGGSNTGPQKTGDGGKTDAAPPRPSGLVPPAECGQQWDEVCYSRSQLEGMVRFGGGQIPISPTPTDEEVAAAFLPSGCLPADRTFDGCCNPASAGPEVRGAECCYIHCTGACCGRPLQVGGVARVAPSAARSDWLVSDQDVAPAESLNVAQAWLEDALLEHASVASFSRFTLELLALGAPASLVEAAQRAGLDEIEHARLCFGLAKRFGAGARGPGPLDLTGVALGRSLAEVVVGTIREGCIGETLAALVAHEQRAMATDPAVKSALSRIADDEARHAELAFALVAWALGQDPALAPLVRRTFEDELARETLSGPHLSGAERSRWLAAGRLTQVELTAIERRAKREVIAAAMGVLVSRASAPCPSQGAVAREARRQAARVG